MGLLERLRERLRGARDQFNLIVLPHYAIKASARNRYFQRLEDSARQAGYLGEFVVDDAGRLRPGRRNGLETRTARLALDVYPNAAAIEGRTIGHYANPEREAPSGERRVPRATVVLEDESERFLRRTAEGLRLEGPAPRFRR